MLERVSPIKVLLLLIRTNFLCWGLLCLGLRKARAQSPTHVHEPFLIEPHESVSSFFKKLLSADFMPHGHCFWWKPEIVWLHALSDFLIGLSYYGIASALLYFFQKRKQSLPFHSMFFLFASFIFCCGTTHFMDLITLWHPIYRADGVMKAITAVISAYTAIVLFPLIPKALQLKSNREFEAQNETLKKLNGELLETQEQLKKVVEEKSLLLTQTEGLLQAFLDHSPFPIWLKDPEGHYVRANQALLKGWGPHIVGKTDYDIFEQPTAHALRRNDAQTLDSRSPRQFEETVELDGQRRTFLSSKFPVPYQPNQMLIGGIAIDITDRKNAELSAERFRAAFGNSIIGLAILDDELNFIEFNEAFCRIAGYSCDVLAQKNLRHLKRDGSLPSELGRVFSGETEHLALEKEWVRGDGRTVFVRLSLSPLKTNFGGPKNIVALVEDVTDRKNAEAALRYQSELTRTLADNATSGLIMVDECGYPTFLNPAAEKITGYTLEEIKQTRIHTAIHSKRPDGSPYPQDECPLNRAHQEGFALHHHEDVFCRKDGSLFEVALSLSPIRGEERIEGSVLEFRDITDKKLAERIEAAQAQVFQLMAAGAPLPQVLQALALTLEQQIRGIACSLLSYQPDQNELRLMATPSHLSPDGVWLGHSLKVAPENGPALLAAFQKKRLVLNNLQDFPALRESFQGCWCEPILNSRSELLGMFVLYSNFRKAPSPKELEVLEKAAHIAGVVIEKFNQEEVLRQREEEFRNLANSIPQLAWMGNARGEATWFNERWYAYTEASLEELQEFGWIRYVEPSYLQQVSHLISEARSNGTPWEATFPLRNREGEYRWFLTRAVPIKDADGNLSRWFVTSTDVTSSLKTQEELVRANAELARFAFVASHDLKEPLRTVSNYAQLLARKFESQLDASSSRYVKYITQNIQQMYALINDLLSYSRVGASSANHKTVDLNVLIHVVLESLGASIKDSNASITVSPLPVVQADPSQMVQLLQNLIANALKYRSTQLPFIQVSAKEQEDAWVVTVQDNGIGIPKEYHEKIFVLFQRLHPKEDYSGTGIGLAVCKKIIEQHRGTIWVESDGATGSAFCFSLPKN